MLGIVWSSMSGCIVGYFLMLDIVWNGMFGFNTSHAGFALLAILV